jgi:hypothetical protein
MTDIVRLCAKLFEDFDDCLSAAVDHFVSEHPGAAGFALNPRWNSDRSFVLLTVPWQFGPNAEAEAKTALDLPQDPG